MSLDKHTLKVVARYLHAWASKKRKYGKYGGHDFMLAEHHTASFLDDMERWVTRHAKGEKPIIIRLPKRKNAR